MASGFLPACLTNRVKNDRQRDCQRQFPGLVVQSDEDVHLVGTIACTLEHGMSKRPASL